MDFTVLSSYARLIGYVWGALMSFATAVLWFRLPVRAAKLGAWAMVSLTIVCILSMSVLVDRMVNHTMTPLSDFLLTISVIFLAAAPTVIHIAFLKINNKECQ